MGNRTLVQRTYIGISANGRKLKSLCSRLQERKAFLPDTVVERPCYGRCISFAAPAHYVCFGCGTFLGAANEVHLIRRRNDDSTLEES
jgi:hypothetical protein